MIKLFPSNLRNRQTTPVVTQPNTAGIEFCSRSLNSCAATICAAHCGRQDSITQPFVSLNAKKGTFISKSNGTQDSRKSHFPFNP